MMENAHNKVIHVENLTKRFGRFTAVKAISFDVLKGEIFGFLGANGAGKTTAIRMLTGLSIPTEGTGYVAGFDINKEQEKIKQNIGYMSQKFSLYEDLTVRENIILFGGIYGIPSKKLKQKADALIHRLELHRARNELVKSIPLGWRQKLAFSVAILHEPRIVFLDEPTSGVDPITRRQFWEMIYSEAEQGMTVLITTHYMDEAEYCDRISIMNHGVIETMGNPTILKQKHNCADIEQLFIKIARNKFSDE